MLIDLQEDWSIISDFIRENVNELEKEVSLVYFVIIDFISKDVGWRRYRKEFASIQYDLEEYRLYLSSVLDKHIVS